MNIYKTLLICVILNRMSVSPAVPGGAQLYDGPERGQIAAASYKSVLKIIHKQ